MTRHSPFLFRLSSGGIRRHHRYYGRAKTPLCHPLALRCLRTMVPSFPLFFVSPDTTREMRSYQAWSFTAFPDGRPCHYSRWNSPGLPGSWGVLSCLCPALRPRPRLPALPVRQFGVAPDGQTTKAATITISGLNHTASALAVYASRCGFPALARLASGGGLTLTGWDSNPLDSYGEFHVGFTRLSIPTPQALPGATVLCLPSLNRLSFASHNFVQQLAVVKVVLKRHVFANTSIRQGHIPA